MGFLVLFSFPIARNAWIPQLPAQFILSEPMRPAVCKEPSSQRCAVLLTGQDGMETGGGKFFWVKFRQIIIYYYLLERPQGLEICIENRSQ